MSKNAIIFFVTVATCLSAAAQTPDIPKEAAKNEPSQKVRVTPYGFVRNYFTYDSRKTYTVIGGEYAMLPYDEDWNLSEAAAQAAGVERTDLNAVPDAKMLAITSRIGLNLDGPLVLGAHSSGKIEADFGGFGTTNSVLRIRQAFVKLNWTHADGNSSELLVGQTWHPMSGDIMPEVLGMAAGAPFRPHSRTPQARYIMSTPSGVGFTAALLYQLQYMYNGPTPGTWATTNSTDFANHAILPEVFLGLNYRNEHIYAQLGSDVQPIRPRTFGVTPANVKVKVDETMVSFSPTAYFQYGDGKFAFKSRYLYAGNTSHLNQLNGYAVTDVNNDGTWSYAPLHAHIAYANFAYGTKWRANLFFGFMKNVGSDKDLFNFGTASTPSYLIYMKGGNSFTHLDGIFRVAPSISYNLKSFNVGLEYEMTAAKYGNLDKNGSIIDDGDLHSVVNNRICMLVKYNF
ncbi:MAG: hypothetical protein SPJ13_00135 [Bacteroidales bacterium]|nr:hypothetical protein [Bacteroidales bacterium]